MARKSTKPIARVKVVNADRPGVVIGKCSGCTKVLSTGNNRQRRARVIVNLYEPEGRWMRTEVFHRDCYEAAGGPYGGVDNDQNQPRWAELS
jgi:hypothetical protein